MEINLETLAKRPLSYSSLKSFDDSPLHYIHYLTKPFESTPALILGNAIDCLVLTPDDFETRYIIMPEINRKTNEGKAQYQEFIEANKTKTWLTQEQLDIAHLTKEAVFKNPVSAELLKRIVTTQKTYRWTDSKTGLPLVAKLDGEGPGVIIDLKSAASAKPEDFMKAGANFDYPFQVGVYLNALMCDRFEFPEFYWIVVEKTAPYGVSVIRAGDKVKEYGKNKLRFLLDSFKNCMDKQLFHQGYEYNGIEEGRHIGELPGWMGRRYTDE